jgi:hypothetical protein
MGVAPELILRHLRLLPGGGPALPLWMVLDAARDEAVYPFVREHFPDAACLYSGEPAEALRTVAPYLVRLYPDRPASHELVSRAWGENWGIFAAAQARPEQLRRHFRYFLRVRDDRGRHLLFRFYDPRVLRVYLQSCNVRELWLFFGIISAFFAEGEDPATLLRFRYAAHRMETDVVDLVDSAADPHTPAESA